MRTESRMGRHGGRAPPGGLPHPPRGLAPVSSGHAPHSPLVARPRPSSPGAGPPSTNEWLDAASALALAPPRPEPLTSLLTAFRMRTPDYERLLRECQRPEVAAKFRDLERLRRKNEVQYETLTGASRR